jgi:hypothetical protein
MPSKVITTPNKMFHTKVTFIFVNCSAAFESIKISNVVQPISCIMFSTAARYDPYSPKAGRIPIIDGTA